MRKLPTIRDVAKKAGVSPTTVSCVLNKKDNFSVSEETINRINEAIDTLGYSPNKMIRSLQNGKSNTIGIGSFRLPGNELVVSTMLNRIAEITAYDMLFYLSNDPRSEEAKNPRIFLDGRIDGVIFNEPLHLNISEYLGKQGFPTVVLLKRNVPDGVASANSDYFDIGRKAVEYLWSNGHRKIAHLAANTDEWEDAFDTMKGYESMMREKNANMIEEWIFNRHSSSIDKCGEALKQWMALPKQLRPTAIFASGNGATAELIKIAKETGIEIPGDISIVGVGNDYFSYADHTPKLASFSVSQEKIGKYAVESLLKIINGEDPHKYREPVPFEFMEGETVKQK